MSVQNYGKKLIVEGLLVCEPRLLHEHDYHKIWTPDFMESITFLSSSKQKYSSVLHFFWQSIFHQREVTNELEAHEIFSSTQLSNTTIKEAKEKIRTIAPDWYEQNKSLIPDAKWIHIIWNDKNDVFISFEDEKMYYAWGWDCTL